MDHGPKTLEQNMASEFMMSVMARMLQAPIRASNSQYKTLGGQRVHDRSAWDNGGRARIVKLRQIYQSRNEGRAMKWHGAKTKKRKARDLDLEIHDRGRGTSDLRHTCKPMCRRGNQGGKRLHLHAGQLVAPGARNKCKSAAHICTQRNCKIGS